MDKAIIAKRVANKLFATEKAVDTAILEASQLLSGLIEAMSKLALALSALNDARQSVVETHNGLAEVQLRLGIRTRLAGGIGPKSHHVHVDNDADQRLAG